MSKTDNTEDNFLGRWSRRKQQNQAEELEGTQAPLPTEVSLFEQESEATDTGLPEQSTDASSAVEKKILTDEDMVPIESLNSDSDYSPFFSEGVSKQLRNMALKKLFFSGKFAFRDGLDDYDDDFTSFEPLGNTVTSDMKFHQRRKEKARLAKLEEERLEEEKRLAAEEAEEFRDESEAAETTDQPSGDEAAEELPEPSETDEQLDTPFEFAEESSIGEVLLADQRVLQNTDTRVLSEQAGTGLPARHPNKIKPPGEDSNNPDSETT